MTDSTGYLPGLNTILTDTKKYGSTQSDYKEYFKNNCEDDIKYQYDFVESDVYKNTTYSRTDTRMNITTEGKKINIKEKYTDPNNNIIYKNYNLLKTPKITFMGPEDSLQTKYGIISHLFSHGSNSIGTFTLPPNIRIITLYRENYITSASIKLVPTIKKLAHIYSQGNKELFTKLYPYIIQNFWSYENIKNFIHNEGIVDFNPIEHNPCTKMTNQEISFKGLPNFNLPQGLIKLNVENDDIIDELTYAKCLFTKRNSTIDECEDFKKHSIIGYKKNTDTYELSSFIYFISDILRHYNPGQVMTIFMTHCRPNWIENDFIKPTLFRADSINIIDETNGNYIVSNPTKAEENNAFYNEKIYNNKKKEISNKISSIINKFKLKDKNKKNEIITFIQKFKNINYHIYPLILNLLIID